MFSGYLQAGIYKGLDGRLGLPGWRWLFIFCGIISLPGPIWGLYAIPDNPYTTKARWLSEDNRKLYIDRMQKIDRRAPVPLSWTKVRKVLLQWPIWIITLMLKWASKITEKEKKLTSTKFPLRGYATAELLLCVAEVFESLYRLPNQSATYRRSSSRPCHHARICLDFRWTGWEEMASYDRTCGKYS